MDLTTYLFDELVASQIVLAVLPVGGNQARGSTVRIWEVMVTREGGDGNKGGREGGRGGRRSVRRKRGNEEGYVYMYIKAPCPQAVPTAH